VLADKPDGSRATHRFMIGRALKRSRGTHAGEVIGYQPIKPPYSPAEVAAFVSLARHQPTDAKRRSLSALVALAVGAGLSGPEMASISPSRLHIVALDGDQSALLVEVSGRRARTAVMSAQFRHLLDEAVRIHRESGRGEDDLLLGGRPGRREAVGPVRQNIVVADGRKVDLDASRLRSTWLVAAMETRVPLATLMRAAGLGSARSFADLLPYCAAPDPADIARVLAAVTTTGGVA